jgi:hypothetical protein
MSATPSVPSMSLQFHCHRIDFSNNCVDLLEEFARIHQYDDRKTFKEAWQSWVQDNASMITTEVNHLQNIDTAISHQKNAREIILDKMFKSVRYYHRKKYLQSKDQEEQYHPPQKDPPPKEKGFSKSFLKRIDESIMDQINHQVQKQNTIKVSLTQKEVFDYFCQEYAKDILQECLYQKERNIDNDQVLDTIVPRLKKTVKNRYYNIRTTISRYSQQKNME